MLFRNSSVAADVWSVNLSSDAGEFEDRMMSGFQRHRGLCPRPAGSPGIFWNRERDKVFCASPVSRKTSVLFRDGRDGRFGGGVILGNEAFRLQRCHTAHAGRCYRLPILVIGQIASREHTGD